MDTLTDAMNALELERLQNARLRQENASLKQQISEAPKPKCAECGTGVGDVLCTSCTDDLREDGNHYPGLNVPVDREPRARGDCECQSCEEVRAGTREVATYEARQAERLAAEAEIADWLEVARGLRGLAAFVRRAEYRKAHNLRLVDAVAGALHDVQHVSCMKGGVGDWREAHTEEYVEDMRKEAIAALDAMKAEGRLVEP